MKETDFINIIKQTIKNDYIGDDCAHLKELGIVVTQDSLVEDVHFKMEYTTPYKLGYKSIIVNISDIFASGAEPKYLTIALSLPKNTDDTFVKQFYEGAVAASNGAEIIGGDITSSDKIFISVCAIGDAKNKNVSSRSFAKIGYKIVVNGEHGSSAAGLKLLEKGLREPKEFVEAHLAPTLNEDLAKKLSAQDAPYAMMDSSDGLGDALLKISEASNVKIIVDFDKIPFNKKLKCFKNFKNLIFFGGEDYKLVAAIPKDIKTEATQIGEIQEGQGVFVKENGILTELRNNSFDHFEK